MGILKNLCGAIANVDSYKKQIKDLQQQIDDRDTILKRIKMVSTSNHYGYSKEDKEYREKNCINVKLRKIYELAREFDKNEESSWQEDED